MANDEAAREWGPWSVWKTELILGAYLPLFARASKKPPHRTFFDCFAGTTQNVQRLSRRALKSSLQLALEVDPPFTNVVALEQPDRADDLRVSLNPRPGQDLRIVPGDSNETIREAVAWWENLGGRSHGPRLGPALAYVDPFKHTDLSWELVRRLADAGMDVPGRKGRDHRIELLILLPTGTMRRTLPVRAGSSPATDIARERVTAMFGSNAWEGLYEAQRARGLSGDEWWEPYSDLYRRQLADLGYNHVSAIEVRNTQNGLLYHLVFASCNRVGKKLFDVVVSHAEEELPRLVEEERRLRAGRPRDSLFDEGQLDEVARYPARYARLLDGQPPTLEELIARAESGTPPEHPDQLPLFDDLR